MDKLPYKARCNRQMTAIAGIYGMNFKHMPELDTAYGYFVVLGVIAISCVFLFVRFKKAKWL